jgi:exonuclease SbcD
MVDPGSAAHDSRMTKTTFMHTGDEHIDSDTHGTINPKTGVNTAWESSFRVIRHLATVAVERKVNAFITAGDSFKNGRPSQEALLMYVEAMSPVAEAGIPIVIIDGNHNRNGVPADHRSAIHVVAEMLRSRGGEVHVASNAELITLDSGLQVAALPWMAKNKILNQFSQTGLTPDEGDAFVSRHGIDLLTEMANAADLSQPLIMTSHVTVDDLRIDAVTAGFKRGSEVDVAHLFSEPVLRRRELELLPYSYFALGHIHAPQSFGSKIWYPGSPDRITFTDMNDVKGGNLVTIEEGIATVELIPTPARVMASLDLASDDYDMILEVLEKDTLVQVVLEVGKPDVPTNIKRAITAAGAILADTKARPKPRPPVVVATMPENTAPKDALRRWAEINIPEGVELDHLVSAAENLEASLLSA